MLNREIEAKLQALKPLLAQKYNVSKLGYFGSFARGEQNSNSDIDVLVEFSKPVGWAFFDLQDFLEKELKHKIDLVSIKALKTQLREIILSEVKYV